MVLSPKTSAKVGVMRRISMAVLRETARHVMRGLDIAGPRGVQARIARRDQSSAAEADQALLCSVLPRPARAHHIPWEVMGAAWYPLRPHRGRACRGCMLIAGYASYGFIASSQNQIETPLVK